VLTGFDESSLCSSVAGVSVEGVAEASGAAGAAAGASKPSPLPPSVDAGSPTGQRESRLYLRWYQLGWRQDR
jgi:hypothetical protein